MEAFPEGFEEIGLSAEDCDRLQKEWGDDEFFRMMYQCGVSFNKQEIVKTVLREGIAIDAPIFNHGATALLLAVDISEDMVRFLLDHGASVNVEDGEGSTPLRKAVLSKNVRMVQLLLLNGADPWHRIPWHILRESDEDENTQIIIQLLLAASADEESEE
jgi:ankyrin repeat protein